MKLYEEILLSFISCVPSCAFVFLCGIDPYPMFNHTVFTSV